MSRTEERRKAWLEAQKESLNRNGMATTQHASPISTRTAAEATRTLNTPKSEPMTRDHSTAAGTTHVQYFGNVRSRLETKQANDRDKQKEQPRRSPEQLASDHSWLEWNEAYKRKHGDYPTHGI